MGLHIVIGYGSAARDAEPKPIYLGYSASAAASAKAADKSSARFEEWHHVSGLRKNNPNFVPADVIPPIETTAEAAKAEAEAAAKAEAEAAPPGPRFTKSKK